jgi:hypothetical protein
VKEDLKVLKARKDNREPEKEREGNRLQSPSRAAILRLMTVIQDKLTLHLKV